MVQDDHSRKRKIFRLQLKLLKTTIDDLKGALELPEHIKNMYIETFDKLWKMIAAPTTQAPGKLMVDRKSLSAVYALPSALPPEPSATAQRAREIPTTAATEVMTPCAYKIRRGKSLYSTLSMAFVLRKDIIPMWSAPTSSW